MVGRASSLSAGSMNNPLHLEMTEARAVVANFDLPKATRPAFTPVDQIFVGALEVTLSSSVGAEIYYTLDGSEPDGEASLYSDPIVIRETTTIRAIALGSNYRDSEISTKEYQLAEGAPPIVSQESQSFYPSLTVEMSHELESATIYYTLDGSEPSELSSIYDKPLVIDSTQTLNAFARIEGYADSQIVTKEYVYRQVELPVAETGGSVSSANHRIAISTPTDGAMIYYTLDGSEPTAESSIYSEPIEISGSTTLKVKALKDGYADSPIVEYQLRFIDESVGLELEATQTGEPFVLVLSFQTREDVTYALRGSFDMAHWEELVQGIAGDGEERSFTVYLGERNLRFFEVVGEPVSGN